MEKNEKSKIFSSVLQTVGSFSPWRSNQNVVCLRVREGQSSCTLGNVYGGSVEKYRQKSCTYRAAFHLAWPNKIHLMKARRSEVATYDAALE